MGNPSPARAARVNFWLKLNRDRERESRVAIFSGDGDSVSRSTSLLLVHFRSLPYEIWRAKEGRKEGGERDRERGRNAFWRALQLGSLRRDRRARGVTFNRFDALHGPENEAVDAMRFSALHLL